MKYSVLLAAAALFGAVRLAAADPGELQPNLPDKDAPVEIRVTTGDANKEIKAKVGEIVVVELESYAADGYYAWSEQPGRSDSVLELEKKDQQVRDYAIGMVRVDLSPTLTMPIAYSLILESRPSASSTESERPGVSVHE